MPINKTEILATILHIETSGLKGSVCIAQDAVVKSCVELAEDNSHARMLTLAIETCARQADLQLNELDAIAYSAGPGSYTGLRIGLSTAKGLCYTSEKPLIGVPTLQSLCNAVLAKLDDNTFLLPMIDARRNDAYVALYDMAHNTSVPAHMATINDVFAENLRKYSKVIAFGNAAFKLKSLSVANVQFAENIDCHATHLVHSALEKFNHQDFDNLMACEPLYIQQMQKPHAAS